MIVAGSFIFIFEDSSETNADKQLNPPRQHNIVYFSGDITAEPGFNITGNIQLSGLHQQQTRFDNFSIRLYREDGSLIKSHCMGTLTDNRNLNVSLTSNELPTYVVFASPEFWTKSTVDDFQVAYYYFGNGDYLHIRWTEPSDVSIDIKRHRPCQNAN
ncbi:hypothetical protein SVXHr_2867 [Halorhabdus sp. SVX81]|nr:hypothetical protein SVXHr_2867 [Halorhabdus sp. SVX81]